MTLNPDTHRLYVTGQGSAVIQVVDTSAERVASTIAVGYQMFGLSIDVATNKIYVANPQADSVYVIDATTGRLLTAIPLNVIPFGVAVNPATDRIYVTALGLDFILVIDGSSDYLTNSFVIAEFPQNLTGLVILMIGITILSVPRRTKRARSALHGI
jgi:YVTN family beta-propeller protein